MGLFEDADLNNQQLKVSVVTQHLIGSLIGLFFFVIGTTF
jgi:hypothetical protein